MKVLFYPRKDYKKVIGGDTIQLLKSKQYLEKLNLKIDVYDESINDINSYDIIHIFNCIPIDHVIRFINKYPNQKFILSPIFWDLEEYEEKVLNRISYKRKLIKFLNIEKFSFLKENYNRFIKNKFNDKLKYCLEKASVILPNSHLEKKYFDDKFNLNEKTFVVPNGIDLSIVPGQFEKIKKEYNIPDKYILCVGRIEYRKNQLLLLQCAEKLKLNVVLVGQINYKEKKYYHNIKNYKFLQIPFLKQRDLYSLYKNATIHILPSWFETPGLATLEAAYNGTQIITTDRGCTKEYFENYAFYCSPDDINSLEKAIIEALKNPKDLTFLQDKIKNNYTWEITARKTLEAYNYALLK